MLKVFKFHQIEFTNQYIFEIRQKFPSKFLAHSQNLIVISISVVGINTYVYISTYDEINKMTWRNLYVVFDILLEYSAFTYIFFYFCK